MKQHAVLRFAVRFLLSGVILGCAAVGQADVFNMPAGQRSLEFVEVGDPGNIGDTLGRGAVASVYRIGKYDVTAAQYTQFLNAVAADDTYGLYNPSMGNALPGLGACGIVRGGSQGSFSYSVLQGRENFPVNYISFGDVARFVNWLQNGQPIGAQSAGTTETGTYLLNGATSNSELMLVTRASNANVFIPSRDEWYKAAYYKGVGTNAGYWLYPTRSNTPPLNTLPDTGNHANFSSSTTGTGGFTDPINFLTPVGAFALSPGPYGTFDQGGNVWQWTERIEASGIDRLLLGGSYGDTVGLLRAGSFLTTNPTTEVGTFGFRVASVPEPGTALLSVLGIVGMGLGCRARTRQYCRLQ